MSPVKGESQSFSFCFVLFFFYCVYLKLKGKDIYEFLKTSMFKDLSTISWQRPIQPFITNQVRIQD